MTIFWDRQNKPIETLDWAAKFEDAEYRIVALDYDGENLMVSTIWQGISSPPMLRVSDDTALIFETAVLENGLVRDKTTWHSEEQALEGHDFYCLTVLGRHARPEDRHRETVIAREAEDDPTHEPHGRKRI
jgi:hypothetical protein